MDGEGNGDGCSKLLYKSFEKLGMPVKYSRKYSGCQVIEDFQSIFIKSVYL
jgi:hypothetical protein